MTRDRLTRPITFDSARYYSTTNITARARFTHVDVEETRGISVNLKKRGHSFLLSQVATAAKVSSVNADITN